MKIPKTRAIFVNVTDRPRFPIKKIKLVQNTTNLANNTKVFTNVTKERATNMTLKNIGTVQHKNLLSMNKTVNDTGMMYFDNSLSVFGSFVCILARKMFAA